MGINRDDLHLVFNKTNGHCYHCGKKIAWKNYGTVDGRGAWEVDHSNPRARGGTDYLRNLQPSCVACNRRKGAQTSGQFGSLRFGPGQGAGKRRVRKKFKNLKSSDLSRMTPADVAYYWRDLKKLERRLRGRR